MMDRNTDSMRLAFAKGGRAGDEQGYSLIEMLVSISILTVIMAGMFSFLWGASKYWGSGQDSADMTDNARIGLNRMTREIRQASSVSLAQPDQVAFLVDFGTGPETITYGFTPGADGQPGTVWRSTSAVPGQQMTLVNDVSTMQFIFYGNDYRCDSNGDGITAWPELQACSSTPAVKVARIDIELTISAGNMSGKLFTDQAWLRNRLVSS